jgi:alanyl-tRNA synthetase
MMESAEIRRRWLRFFESENRQGLAHTVVPSASLIADDPTLLLVNAGMVPFKPFFLGEQKPPYQRATSVQKCVRTLDIDEVGKTTRHASFFQMCGNFSFGDYFKEGAIALAWDLLTREQSDGGYGFPEERLWVTVYHDDDEAADIWHNQVGVPRDRIQRRGMADNFWSMGVPGPCGPCSEIYYDRGPEYGREGGPVADEDRYLEIWNLVFMQFERGAGGGKEDYPILGELPAKNIDTGLGLERTAALLQGVENIYEIDTTRMILDRASELTGVRYGSDDRHDVSLRVVADHARTALMLIGDGVTPGNEGRGYVLRRMMRRTIRNMRLMGSQDPIMRELIDASILAMGPQYPELVEGRGRIEQVAVAEEEAFLSTLKAGTTIFDTAVASVRAAGGTQLAGEDAFKLHDTYGFPIDLTLEMAGEAGISVDDEGFRRLMKEQRERAKADAKAKKMGHADVTVYRDLLERLEGGKVEFIGYEHLAGEGAVVGLVAGGNAVSAVGAGSEVEIVLQRTPFYAEGGGQLADGGRISLPGGAIIDVDDVQSPIPGVVVHRGRVIDGEVQVGASAYAEVDVERRRSISRAHTATHLVHKAFRDALGETATQAGSENAPGRFRFDFAATGAVAPSVLRDVEQRVNEVLAEDLRVHAEVMSQVEAKAMGAMALFGEKYGERVRVVSVGDYARELCGGTHAASSGQLGLVTLLGESSIGAGVRRVEALVGVDAYRFLAREHVLVNSLTELIKGARPEELPERISGLLSRVREMEKEVAAMRAARLLGDLDLIVTEVQSVNGLSVLAYRVPDGTPIDDVRKLVGSLKGRVPSGHVLAIPTVFDGKPAVAIATDDGSRARGAHAGALVKVAAGILGGGGGGKDDIAQGGGTQPEKVGEALDAVVRAVRDLA